MFYQSIIIFTFRCMAEGHVTENILYAGSGVSSWRTTFDMYEFFTVLQEI